MEVAAVSCRPGARRRELGSYYTPRSIVRRMLEGCLEACGGAVERPLRILDPACGDGAFLLEAFEILRARDREEGGTALRIVREQLFGVDIDRVAVRRLRRRLLERMAVEDSSRPGAVRVLRKNIRCGDALSGEDFSGAEKSSNGRAREGERFEEVNWKRAFPEAAGEGGFDLVIGNPPYRRERDARELFARVAGTPLGEKWRQARMDYWYYFLHRGLDLLKPRGRLSFIVNSYWTGSAGAGKLIERLMRETMLEEITLLGSEPIFRGVAGRHMIFRLRKGREECECRIEDCSSAGVRKIYQVLQRDLYHHGRLSLAPPQRPMPELRSTVTLGDLYEVRQGMAENPPFVSARHVREFGARYRCGEGVFVLTADEVEALKLSKGERRLLRPYYRTAAVGRYELPESPTHWVLYLTKATAPSIESLLRIAAHLERFRPLLERRRETRAGSIGWWCLHWPREERIFTQPGILSVQMGRRPQFVFAERPAFVGFSVNVVLEKPPGSFGLPVLTAILNSSFAEGWFGQHAKQRGVHLEINGNHLKRFPLPERDAEVEGEIERLVVTRQGMRSTESEVEVAEIEKEIDELVRRLYQSA